MKVTADTNFFISATQWNKSVAYKLLIKLIEKEINIYTTTDILNEFSKVLSRDFKYNSKEISHIISKLTPIIYLVEPTEKVDIVKDDPDDNKIIECALASNSDYIITYDNHLLNIREFQGIKIIKPEEMFRII